MLDWLSEIHVCVEEQLERVLARIHNDIVEAFVRSYERKNIFVHIFSFHVAGNLAMECLMQSEL